MTYAELAAAVSAVAQAGTRPVLYCHPHDLDRIRRVVGRLPTGVRPQVIEWNGTQPDVVVLGRLPTEAGP